MELLGVYTNALEKKPEFNYLDGLVVFTNDFSSFYKEAYSKDEIISLLKKYPNKKIIIDLQFMLENDEILALTDYINDVKEYNPYYLVSDLGAFYILKKLGLASKTIYNPNTLVTNSYDINFYLRQGMDACGISLEITVDDQQKLLNEASGFMQVFGYHLMFHSKRYLVSLYKEFLNKDFATDNENSYLIEQTRKDKYHIYESKRGTSLFRPYIVDYSINFDKLSNLKYGFIDNIFIDDEAYFKAIKIYHDLKDNVITSDVAQALIKNLGYDVNDGFKYQDTVYQKELIECLK